MGNVPTSGARHLDATLPFAHQTVPLLEVGARPVVLATWALWLALLLALAWRGRAQVRAHLRFLAQALAVVLLGAVVIGLCAPRAPLHEYAEFNLATEPFFAEWPTAYGEALVAPALAADRLLHLGVPSLFLVNGALATAAIAALIAMTLVLFADRRRALLAGVLLALWPLCVRYAASEEPFAALTLLVAASLTAWRVWLDRRSPLLLALSVVSAALAMQLRPEWLLLPFAHLTLTWALRRDFAVSRRQLVWATAALLVLLLPHLWQLAHAPQRSPQWVGLLPQKVGVSWLRTQWQWTSVAALPLAGLAVRVRRPIDAPTTRWLLGFYAAATVLPFAFYASSGPFAWRMQILPSAFVCVLLANAPRGLPGLAPRWRLAVVVALAVLQFAALVALVRVDLPQQQEWRFLTQTVPRLPRATYLTAPFGDAAGRFPRYLGLTAGQEWQELDATAPVLQQPPDARPHLVYLGLWCWIRPEIVHGNQLTGQAACARVRDRYTLTPVAEATIPPTTLLREFTLPPAGRYNVGFYWAERRSQ